ncbi:hypothetical protein Shyhy01_11290 [Streptomyces hygroscopicus subsp. hygroscopicus]|nr:ADP-ribosylglycohydrolase family protein [Streptomyces hygroscopicus]GLX48179.1 hypothetical protein Shyhy01_11290 [Streptomyces hygroscopicus subsp. hygroscopicus]
MASTACTPPLPAAGGPLQGPEGLAGPHARARGALLGLAVGDALGAPAENLKPSEIRARWGRITGYVTDRPQGTDDTEYALFSGLLLARHGSALTPAHAEAAWHEWIADRAEGTFRGAGFSERGTLENLRRGLAAPISAQHRHAWSDGLAMRAAPFGVFAAGRPGEAARLVAIDGSVSHEGEGIYGGQAVAAGVAAAMAGAPVPVVIAAALAVIPDDSWTARSLRRAVAVAHRGERAVRSAVVIGGYPWTDLAPEAVALAFGAYATADGDFREAVLTAVNMGRDADTTAAVAGALSGATQGAQAIPADWANAIGPARGRCLPSMAGRHVLEVAELLVAGAGAERRARDGRGTERAREAAREREAEVLLPSSPRGPAAPEATGPAAAFPPLRPTGSPALASVPASAPLRPTEPPALASTPLPPTEPPALASALLPPAKSSAPPTAPLPPTAPSPSPAPASRSAEPPPCLQPSPQPVQAPPPSVPPLEPVESGGGRTTERADDGRSPLVGADSEARA